MRAVAVGLLVASMWLAAPRSIAAYSIQESILRVKPAAVLITTEVRADVTLNCGRGPVAVTPPPFVETGTGWFVDGRGFIITNAHVVDPAYRLPAWVTHELKKKAIDEACVVPVLTARGIMRGQRPDLEEEIRRAASTQALATAKVEAQPQITAMLSNGTKLRADVKKFSPLLLLDNAGKPLPDSGRDLALLRVADGVYPAIGLSRRDPQIGDPVHILGFPGVVLSHELLNQSSTLDASATNGTVSGIKFDAIGQELVQTDASASHGNSGGPGVNNDAELVGVMVAVTLSPSGGSIVQGFNFLIPAKDVAKFLDGTEVTKPGDSKFNPVWAAGIELFLGGRYKAAVAKLEDANKLVPNLVDVKRTLDEANRMVKNPPPRPFPWAWATLGVTVLSGGAYGGMWGKRWWKNRFRVTPTQVITFIERGLNPALLDVRTKAEFETSPLKLPGSMRYEPETAEQTPLNLEPAQLIVAYCTSPEEQQSARIVHLLRQRGFKNVRILKGGLGGWTNARLPVEAKSALPSVGLELYKNLSLGDIERRRFKPGDYIFKEGDDPRDEAFVIHSGTVEIRRNLNGAERVVNRIGEGEPLGEMALFRGVARRSAAAVAADDVELLVIKEERLEWLVLNRPRLALELLKRLSNLVVATDQERAQPVR
ncbi:MAG TPA: trypsin-like peptidase domain-containing protein [Methylomirabilota bacterium]|jgi:S1-C subfamily serine protease/rhodanese-related sulfurtransferase|nr:trypsin-like peptidase domain-containing protein [Methylomirabilota bacterium]